MTAKADERPKLERTPSEEYFRTVMSNYTGLRKDHPMFDEMTETDKKTIKEAGKAMGRYQKKKNS